MSSVGAAVRPATGTIVVGRPGRVGLVGFLFIGVQLVLLALVVRQFQIESSAFRLLLLIAFGGFAVHAFLPLPQRLPFFVILSLVGIGLVIGWADGAWLVAVGLVLIGLCHLPVPFAVRVALLVAAGILLAMMRSEWLAGPWSGAVWPILGSMFMFRLVVYIYDLRHDSAPVSPWRTLAYFFLLPNVCFPLFPVVDFKTFRRTYFEDDAYRVYQRGVDWMVRGAIQLVVYRGVYYNLTLAHSEVADGGDLARFLVSNFLLYLRVSGQFHLIVGMLHLFGFHLPLTHDHYLLAQSFTDFWRRINIYWKDFMQKVFFNPTYFALRHRGPTQALVVATLLVFFATWSLHAYQWFWLRGKFLLAGQDIGFWAVLAGLVVVNALWEMKHGRQRAISSVRLTSWGGLGRALRTAGTFAAICILWSFWTSESLSQWLALWTVLLERPGSAARHLAPLLTVVAVLAITASPGRGGVPPRRGQQRWGVAVPSTLVTLASLGLMALLGLPQVYGRLGTTASSVIQALRSGQLSRVDTALLERGYYEDLLRVDRFNSQLWEVYMKKPLNWLDVNTSGLDRVTRDFSQKELVPSVRVQTGFGPITTNRWGMRDREYELRPAPGTYRGAVLGASTVMGWGVADHETFENVLEDRLNRERRGRPHARYELLNFAVPGYLPTHQLPTLERALAFQPAVVFYVVAGHELSAAVRHLARALSEGVPVPYEFLREHGTRAGVDVGISETIALRRLEPHRAEVLAAVYHHVVGECRKRGVLPVLVFVPWISEGDWQQERPDVQRLAERAGFVVLDVGDVFRGHDPESLRLAEWDGHPNAHAHQLVADRLYDLLTANAPQLLARADGPAVAADVPPPTGEPPTWRMSECTTSGIASRPMSSGSSCPVRTPTS